MACFLRDRRLRSEGAFRAHRSVSPHLPAFVARQLSDDRRLGALSLVDPSDPGTAAPKRALRRLDTERVDCNFEVDMHSEHNFFTGFSENISEGGIFVATYAPRNVGDVLVLEIGLPGVERKLRAVVEVRWLRAHAPEADTPPGFGATILKITDEDRGLVELFVRHRKPLFHPD
ncbi:MAG: TIGR02266 family protein [Polyangiales bacterium]